LAVSMATAAILKKINPIIWVEMIFGLPTFKIMCNFRCQIENQVSDYRLLGASSYYYSSTHFCPFYFSEMPWSNLMKYILIYSLSCSCS
jgi:hypothetical protein